MWKEDFAPNEHAKTNHLQAKKPAHPYHDLRRIHLKLVCHCNMSQKLKVLTLLSIP